ncbi:MAG: protein kinase [Kiritimatiellaeota bacterium]|nr:protein kinase [Kiritimatiellota bacterium]
MSTAENGREKTKRLPPEEMGRIALRNAQAETIDSAELAKSCPRKIGKYPVKRFLAGGGMGQVYLGTHPQFNIDIVIKVIRPEYSRNERYVDRFLKEAKLASRLNHPNIVRVYDADRDGDTCFMVQEYVDGGDLALLLRASEDGVLEPDRALEIVTGVTRGLVAAEKAGIVHRDIKPENILLDRDGQPKIADLGLAKQHGPPASSTPPDPRLTQEGTRVGSPAYMAPEQVEASGKVDIRTDIYALGVTFYELLTGEIPFSGTSMQEMLAKHLVKDIGDPCRVNPQVPKHIGQIVQKMAARRTEDRYQSATELLTALERAARPFLFRHLRVVAIILLLMAIAAGAATTYWLAPRQNGPLATAETYIAQGQPEKALPLLEGLVRRDPRNTKAWYALGLARLDKGDATGVDRTVAELKGLQRGAELADQLRAMQLLKKGEERAALDLVNKWEGRATYRLPFLYVRGMVHFKQRDLDRAQADLETAVHQASVFPFQRFAVVDALARLFTLRGRPDQARNMYAMAFKADKTGPLRPAFYTNYAVTLLNAGNPNGAEKPLRLALELDPGNGFARYLEKAVARARSRNASDQVQATLKMIDDVNSLVRKRQLADAWTSPPLVLTFLPPEDLTPESGRLGEGEYLIDLLTDAVQALQSLPVVDRESLAEILREHKINASDLASPAARFQVGRFLPASILVRSRFSHGEKLVFRLQLIDVSTSENLAVLAREIAAKDTALSQFMQETARDMLRTLLQRKPVRGKVIRAEGGTFELNVGRWHGLAPGSRIAVYPAATGASPRLLRRRKPVAEGRISDLDRFQSTAEAETGSPQIEPGMLVMVRNKAAPQ